MPPPAIGDIDTERSAPSLPTGTVTLLFTDIEGSTRLLQQLGDRYADILGDYRRLLRAIVQEKGGQEVDTQGDTFFFCLPPCPRCHCECRRGAASHNDPSVAQRRYGAGSHGAPYR